MGFNSGFKELMYQFSYSKSSCLSNTPTSFGARQRHLQGVPSQLVHHVVGELLETIWRTEKLSWDGTPWRKSRQAPKRVGVLLTQRDLVYEKWRIKCWFNEGKVRTNTMHGVHNAKTSCVFNSISFWQSYGFRQTQREGLYCPEIRTERRHP